MQAVSTKIAAANRLPRRSLCFAPRNDKFGTAVLTMSLRGFGEAVAISGKCRQKSQLPIDCHVARFASLLAMTNLAVCTAPLPSPWERVARRSRDGCGSAGSTDKSCSSFGLPRSLRSLAMTSLVLQFLRCHCEASKKPWQSRGSIDKICSCL